MTIIQAQHRLAGIKSRLPASFESAPIIFEDFVEVSNFLSRESHEYKLTKLPIELYGLYFTDGPRIFV